MALTGNFPKAMQGRKTMKKTTSKKDQIGKVTPKSAATYLKTYEKPEAKAEGRGTSPKAIKAHMMGKEEMKERSAAKNKAIVAAAYGKKKAKK